MSRAIWTAVSASRTFFRASRPLTSAAADRAWFWFWIQTVCFAVAMAVLSATEAKPACLLEYSAPVTQPLSASGNARTTVNFLKADH
ncbi:hypothetical protein RCCGEPOP_04646, partial [Rhizobium sp. Pop5]